MASKIVLFGATGYTGRLTAEAMVARGMRPVLAARSESKLERLAADLGGNLENAVADVSNPPSIARLVGRGDVLVTTVGPFVRFGEPAVVAAATSGAHYFDSTGEPPFIRSVFERYDSMANKEGCGLLTAFGYDFVPGNLAGALALRDGGEEAVRVDVGYFMTGRASTDAMSGGTRASLMGVLMAPSFAWRDGRLRTEPGARHVRTFEVNGRSRQAVSCGASEHFGLPAVAPRLREVNAYLGWFGPFSRAMQGFSIGGSVLTRLPGVNEMLDSVGSRLAKGSTGGPDEEARSRLGSHVVGIAYDGGGRALSEVHLTGGNGYDFTARILAWGAERAAAGDLKAAGALGPVEAFGLDELEDGCAEAGLAVAGAGGREGAAAGAKA